MDFFPVAVRTRTQSQPNVIDFFSRTVLSTVMPVAAAFAGDITEVGFVLSLFTLISPDPQIE